MKPKREMLRVVKSPAGEVGTDATGKAPGRGAYVCKSAECFKKSRKTRALSRALETEINEAVLNQLGTAIEEASREEDS